jgi:hypothetical protein
LIFNPVRVLYTCSGFFYDETTSTAKR